MSQSRRDFLKLLGLAAGATLSGCGGSDSISSYGGTTGAAPVSVPTPTAYQFIPVAKSGMSLPVAGSFAKSEGPFMGGVAINDRRHVYFHCLDLQDVRGVYRVDVSKAGGVEGYRSVIREGDVLPDGFVVDDFSDGEYNNNDDCLFTVEDANGLSKLEYCQESGAFRPLATAGQELNPNAKFSGEICEIEALDDAGNILFVAEYLDAEGQATGEGVFYMPANQPGQCQLLIANDQLIPGTTAAIRTFGCTELKTGGRYVIQGSACPTLGGEASDDGAGFPFTYVLTGRVGQTPQLVAVDRNLGTPGAGYELAATYMCPRIGGVDSVGCVVQYDSARTGLLLDKKTILQGNADGGAGASPKGSPITTILPPCYGPQGLVYFEVFTMDGIELCVYDGTRTSTILARGDVVNGKTIENIIFGCLPESVNANGDFVTIVETTDGEAQILVGIPV